MEDEFDYSAEADAADLQSFRDTMAAARLKDSQAAVVASTEKQKPAGDKPASRADSVMADKASRFGFVQKQIEFVRNLPKNISLGVLDAGVNTVNLADDVVDKVSSALTGMQDEQFEDTKKNYDGWRAELNEEATTGDTLVQGISQFAIPFMGWAKAAGVARGAPMLANIAGSAAAETVTSMSVLDPHAGRMTDLIELGRESESRFGDVLNRLSPDGSLANQYIEYMNEREGEGEWEGRFKNTLDSLTTSAAAATFLKGASSTFKQARKLPDKFTLWRPSEIEVGHDGAARELNTGLVFDSDTDAQAFIDELQHQYGPGFEQRMAAEHTKASDKNFATLHSFTNVLRANADKPVRTSSLVDALERNIKGDTETGAFYKELLGRLKAKNLGGMTTVTSEAGQSGTSRGGFSPGSNAIKLYPNAFKGGPLKLLHTFTHEAVHAATIREVRASAEVSAKLTRLHKRIAKAFENAQINVQNEGVELPKNKAGDTAVQKGAYGFKDPEEFIAEIESNPEFRKLMKQTMIDGESAWDKYRKAIGGILGIGALAMNEEFDKLMDPQDQQEDDGA